MLINKFGNVQYVAYICAMKNTIIYGLRCPKTDDYKYIGKTTVGLKRAQAHIRHSHNELVNFWVQELKEQGLSPLVDVLEECSEEELQIKEQFWIQFYIDAGCVLFNTYICKFTNLDEAVKNIAVKKYSQEKDSIISFVKRRRKDLRLTQEALAEIAGVSFRATKAFELGQSNPTYNTIEKILDVLGCELIPVVKKMS
jgi:DNA-binding XRE family transcriptional regulator